MKKVLHISKVIICIYCLLHQELASAQMNVSGRSVALSGCNSNLQDEWSVFQNPAGTAFLKKYTAGVSYKTNYLAKELSQQSFVVVLPLNNYGVSSFGYSQFGYELYRQQEITFGWSRSYSDKFSAGIDAVYSRLHLGENLGNSSSLKFRAGIQVKLTSALQLGVVIENPLRPKISTYNDDRSAAGFYMGIQYRFSPKLVTYVQADQQSKKPSCFRFAIEYNPVEHFFLRGGLASKPLSESFGFGFKWKQIRIDVSSAYHRQLGFSPTFSLLYDFNKHEN